MATIFESLTIAIHHHKAGRLAEAENIYRQVLQLETNHVDAIHLLGVIAYQQGRHALAVEYIERAIKLQENAAVFHDNLGRAYSALRMIPEAAACFQRYLLLRPADASAHTSVGNSLRGLGLLDDAVACYRRALELKPDEVEAYLNLGYVLKDQAKLNDAFQCFHRARELAPNHAETHLGLGSVFKSHDKLDEAILCFRRALKLKPDFVEALNNLGNALKDQRKPEEAIACYLKALELKPDYVKALLNLGNAYKEQWQREEALTCYRRALELKPDFAEAHSHLGTVLLEQGKVDEAAACYRRALELKPDYAEAHSNLGNALRDQGKLDDAIASYRHAFQLKPDSEASLDAMIHSMQHACCWDGLHSLSERLLEIVDRDVGSRNATSVSPFSLLALPAVATPKQQLQCARHWVNLHLKSTDKLAHRLVRRRVSRDRSKIVVGYLSATFHSHAMAGLIAEAFEKHDRQHFEWIGYSYSPNDESPARRRMVAALDRVVDVKSLSFLETSQRIAADGVDILVDLMGYTTDARTEIMALRPAPIQVTYLGFPGTLGAEFIDYVFVDDYVVPSDQQPFFTENLVHLPGCYFVNDSQRPIAARTPTRAECGLPDTGFIFCTFNNSYKITPRMFDVWMAFLKAVPGSVLWLLESNPSVPKNLRKEAEARGVAPGRLVFAPRCTLPEHLARHRLADLFIDTFPYTAHTTAVDALWAGLPLVTLAGQTFASRVAGSMLRTLGLPELITYTIDDYRSLVLQLAMNPERLATVRAKIAAHRATTTLFSGEHFARSTELAYQTMWEIHSRGDSPQPIMVSNPMDAVSSCRKAVALQPGQAGRWNNLGNALKEQGNMQEAIASYRRALELKPDLAQVHFNLGNALVNRDDAFASLRRAVELKPDYAEAHLNLGNVLLEQGKLEDAIASYRLVLNIKPDFAEVWSNLGNALRDQGKLGDAVAMYDRALALDSLCHPLIVLVCKGLALSALGRVPEAEAAFGAAIKRDPENVDARVGLAMLHLKADDYQRGWPEYEWRRRFPEWKVPDFQCPAWDGSPLEGRSIIIHAEQGLGDYIQFLRFVPKLRSEAGRVALLCAKPLYPLMKSFPGVDQLVQHGDAIASVDVWAPLLSLPLLLKLRPESFAIDQPYLTADESLVLRWRDELAGFQGLRIGIAWRGSAKYKRDRSRSFDPVLLNSIAALPGVTLISLQLEADDDPRPDVPIHRFSADFDRTSGAFMDTAAVLKNVDFLIACDSAVAHLAGALHVPTWLALSYDCDWRWGYHGSQTPWYPRHRLFRQKNPGDWESVFAAMRLAIQELPGRHDKLKRQLPGTEKMNVREAVNIGVELFRAGKLADAEQQFRAVLAEQPQHADALHLLGVVAGQAGRWQEAVDLIGKAIAQNDRIADYYSNRGVYFLLLKQWDQAEASFQRCISLKPDSPAALNGLGTVANERKDYQQARGHFEAALKLTPEFPEALVNLARALTGLDQPAEAIRFAEQAVALRPEFAEAHFRLAQAHKKLGQVDRAKEIYQTALRLNPKHSACHTNLGNIFAEQAFYEEALACYAKSLALQPPTPSLLVGQGLALMALERVEESRASLKQALALDPEYGDGHMALSTLLLKTRDYARGWPEYEWRRVVDGWSAPNYKIPPWDGSPLAGRGVLLHTEQGYGDLIQFLRFVPRLRQQTERILFITPPPLNTLLKLEPGIAPLLVPETAAPTCDVWAPVLSLPLLLNLSPDSYGMEQPYLRADEALIQKWRAKLQPLKGLRIAVAWSGNPKNPRDNHRSFALSDLAPLFALPGITWLSVQKSASGDAAADYPVQSLGEDFDGPAGRFMDTAAVLKTVDLLIACDSAVAHLAGALGVPTWLALCFDCDWRWGFRDDRTPWYPGHRLFRQPRPRDWTGCFAAMAAALAECLQT